ncbi:hypothetical protein LEP1GSC017_3450 [Leptospira meyeri serovar Hardjo str. Went 5]|nr:hypothetical protein LEP1GSC017_3450 [Leptospira meyeri serovar Hardjo str. Went 5]
MPRDSIQSQNLKEYAIPLSVPIFAFAKDFHCDRVLCLIQNLNEKTWMFIAI